MISKITTNNEYKKGYESGNYLSMSSVEQGGEQVRKRERLAVEDQ